MPRIPALHPKTIKINGKSTDIKGVILSNFDTSADTFSDFVDVNKIVSCFENAKHEIEEKRQKLERERKIAHDAEYAAIMSGEKPLDIRYNDGENCFGPVAYGVSAEIIEALHCGHDVTGFGTIIDEEFRDGDIVKMKQHFQQWQAQQEAIKAEKEARKKAEIEEKNRMLEGVVWDIEKKWEDDEEGKTVYYVHTFTIDDKTYQFKERNLFDVGVVVNPCYRILPNAAPGGIVTKMDGKYCWEMIANGDSVYRDITDAELKAVTIIHKYGKFAKSMVRM